MRGHDSGTGGANAGSGLKEFRGLIVAVVGLMVLLGIAALAIGALPESIPRGATDTNKGESVVAISTALATAVGSLVAAYFGIRSANAAREEAGRAVERSEVTVAHVTGRLESTAAADALREAEAEIQARGLSAGR